MRTFHWSAPIFIGAGALVIAFFAPAPPSLGAGEPTASPRAAKGDDTVLASLAELKTKLDPSDRDMAMRALDLALNEIGDGSALVWKRPARDLEGRIDAVAAFQDDQGRICRRIKYALTLGKHRSRAEGIACRKPDGRWTFAS